ncbi:MAG: hypothetical protein A3D65_05715 [Candidatus Lloydbacteria bacterium RIFCSPHIGHO2_02_FULL_50_13]|uniref:Uncharacterized protein n=1 Tax=Candidatus Lloydbacteria bacterium RIFCSPHIGHO2_02_FULL_50_13 TaxID=1798661 RepID=A0A1G2D2Q4_9BACT|nr:MAG: hypothetical protein A3D65_05715 [Candidatus Lloydbacteria bacterium RIFCSPHIGHO2_02_FULL_50_13]
MQYSHHLFSFRPHPKAAFKNLAPKAAFGCGILFLFPTAVFAQADDIFDLSGTIYDLLGRLGVFFFALAVMLFIWGVVKFIKNANDTTEHEAGKKFILWGIISFVVLVSLWAIAELVLVDTFDIDTVGELEYIDKNDDTL